MFSIDFRILFVLVLLLSSFGCSSGQAKNEVDAIKGETVKAKDSEICTKIASKTEEDECRKAVSRANEFLCIFQKGFECESFRLEYEKDAVSLKLKNNLDSGILISGVICSAESIDPSTGIPVGRDWNSGAVYPKKEIPSGSSFEIAVPCFTESGKGVGTLEKDVLYHGFILIQYRASESQTAFKHVILGNLQGYPS